MSRLRVTAVSMLHPVSTGKQTGTARSTTTSVRRYARTYVQRKMDGVKRKMDGDKVAGTADGRTMRLRRMLQQPCIQTQCGICLVPTRMTDIAVSSFTYMLIVGRENIQNMFRTAC